MTLERLFDHAGIAWTVRDGVTRPPLLASAEHLGR
jgi:hypothetical protein